MFRFCTSDLLRRSTALLAMVGWMLIPAQQSYAADVGAIVAIGNWTAPLSWSTNAVPISTDDVYIGSTYPASSVSSSTISLTQNQSARNVFLGFGNSTSGTVALGNFDLSATSLTVGASGSGTGAITRGTGKLVISGTVAVNNNSFAFATTDTTATLNLSSGTVSTAAQVNVTANVNLSNTSTLTLNNNLNLTGNLQLTSSTLNAQSNNITAPNSITLTNAAALITNRGTLTTNSLNVTGQTFNVAATDAINTYNLTGGATTFVSGAAVATLNLSGSTGTTVAVGNVTANVNLSSASTLTLNNNLSVVNLGVTSSTLNAQSNNITAPNGINLTNAAALITNRGTLTTNSLNVTGQTFNVAATDAINTYNLTGGATTFTTGVTLTGALNLTNSTAAVRAASIGSTSLSTASILTVKSGQPTGLTITNTGVSAITINDTSKLRLELDGNIQGWVLRWANPGAGNHVADLNALITANKIDFTVTNGGLFSVVNNADGFTYIYQPVPEPATTLLIAAGGLASAWVIRRRRLVSV